jgi:dCMP deaminase
MTQKELDIQYLKIAKLWSENSKAERSKVGAIIVKNNMIISDGYNGTPSGFDNCCEIWEPQPSCWKKAQEEDIRGIGCEGEARDIIIDGYAKLTCNHPFHCKYAKCTTKPEVLHAEANAITKLAKSTQSSDNSTLYVTMSPCFDCAKLIIQSGIKRVVYCEEYRKLDGIELLKKAGIKVEKINIEENDKN